MTPSLFKWLTFDFSAPLKSFDHHVFVQIFAVLYVPTFYSNFLMRERYSCQGNDILQTPKAWLQLS